MKSQILNLLKTPNKIKLKINKKSHNKLNKVLKKISYRSFTNKFHILNNSTNNLLFSNSHIFSSSLRNNPNHCKSKLSQLSQINSNHLSYNNNRYFSIRIKFNLNPNGIIWCINLSLPINLNRYKILLTLIKECLHKDLSFKTIIDSNLIEIASSLQNLD